MNFDETRPVWAEINLDHLAHNIREVRRVTRPDALVTAVVKADGYGHGAAQIASTLRKNGADRFAVATLSEAISLRKADVDTPILILGYTPENLAKYLLQYNLIQTVYSYEQAVAFSEVATLANRSLTLHIKLDTGMNRIGFVVGASASEKIAKIMTLPNLYIEGIYTHFARADEKDKTTTHLQVKKFLKTISDLAENGFSIPIKHVANSAAIIDLPEYNFDMVRAGIMLYGLYPSPNVNKSAVVLKEVMSLKARVSLVKRVPSGEGIGYGHLYKTTQDSFIVSLPLGYADGYTRMLTEKVDVILKGERAPVIGRICMDQCMVLTTCDDVKRDDIVTLFGSHEGAFKSIDEVAGALGTINYEVVCMVDKRVPRRYYLKGTCVNAVDDVLKL